MDNAPKAYVALKDRKVYPFAHYMQGTPAYSFPRGATVYSENDPADRIFYLRSGLVKLHATSETGNERTVQIIYPGQIFGEPAVLSGRGYPCNCEVIAEATISWMSREQILHLVETEPEFCCLLLDSLSRKLMNRVQATFRETFLNVRERVALALLDLISRRPSAEVGAGGHRLTVTHQELASLVGSSRVAVTNALNEMARSGDIVISRNYIQVANLHALKDSIRPALVD